MKNQDMVKKSGQIRTKIKNQENQENQDKWEPCILLLSFTPSQAHEGGKGGIGRRY